MRISSDYVYRWTWLGWLKQPDGGFALSVDGEEDVRYAEIICIPYLKLLIASGALIARWL